MDMGIGELVEDGESSKYMGYCANEHAGYSGTKE